MLAGQIQAKAGLPQIAIGIDSGDPTGASDGNWTKNVLADGLAGGFVPGFISDHSYMQAAGAESDSFLLNDTVSCSGSVLDWSTRYADYQALLQQTLGNQAASVQVMATEYNSVATDPGKQSTSLVNGLFIADSLGSLLDSGYSGGFVWNLRNYFDTGQNNSNGLYGWREGGDYGQLGAAGDSSPPTTGSYVAYPGYYALQLASKIIRSGGQVVSAASNYSDLDVYAVKESSGDLALLVINVNPAASLTEQFNLTGFQPGGAVQVWQYGEAQDTAQSQSSSGASALAGASATVGLSGSKFNYTFPAYSMTVLALAPAGLAPTVAAPASAAPSPVTGTTTVLSVLGADSAGESNLTYTWTATGTPPAAVSFSANGTNAAKNTTARFSKAGSYSFLVTITDVGGRSTTSSVGVTVNQTLTSIVVAPAKPALASHAAEQFTAAGSDQFGAAMGLAGTTWSATAGSISSSGLFTAPYASASVTVTAASGSVKGSTLATVKNATPTVARAAAATPSPVTGTTTVLSVLGADDAGESNLTYTWTTIGTPPAAVSFSANGTNAAKSTTARFTKAGIYKFLVTITDLGGLSITSSVNVTVAFSSRLALLASDAVFAQYGR